MSALGRLRGLVPQGGMLPVSSWDDRHRWIVRLLCAHLVAIPAFGLFRDYSGGHMLLETSVIALAAIGAQIRTLSRRQRAVIASFGLMSCSGILVHLSGGLIEMHFHFFVMVAVVSLYQDWLPFLTAISYVFVSHGLFGVLDPFSVYNHADAVEHPWKWAGIHATFIAAESVACLANWRLTEFLYASEHLARVEAEDARRDLKLLVDASEALTSSFDIDVMLAGLVALVSPGLAEGCAVDLLDEQGTVVRAAAVGTLPPDVDELVLTVIRGGGARAVDVEEMAAVVAPLVGRGGVLGALVLGYGTDSLRREGVTQVAAELGARAGIAVENARLYARERSVAVTLQHALLPERLPTIPGVDNAARYVAGGPGVDVGGDWYDVIPLPRSRLLVVMGDVVGRGEKAAALMGHLRSALRGHALIETSPAALLTHLNRLLNDASQADMATLVCALLDPASGELTVASAGHPPPAMVSEDQQVAWVSVTPGPPLGAVASTTYAEALVQMPPGSTLVLYTDGLVEDRTLSLDDGLERLRAALEQAPTGSDALCGFVLERTLGDRKADDDTALLAVRLLPLGPRLAFELPLDTSSLEPLRAALGRWLVGAGATPEESYEVQVATCEAAANAMVHARGSASSRVHVTAHLDGDVHVEVTDSGSWRPARAGTGGRGLHIMESFMDKVQIDRTHEGTSVKMRRRLGSDAGVLA